MPLKFKILWWTGPVSLAGWARNACEILLWKTSWNHSACKINEMGR